MVGARAGEWIEVVVVRNAHVAELGMEEAMDRAAAHQPAAADPGADRDVAEHLEPFCSAPAMLTQRGCVDICVECDRRLDLLGEHCEERGVRPAGLRGRRDRAEARRALVEVYGAEAAHPNRCQALVVAEERSSCVDGSGRVSGREGGDRFDVVGPGADGADPFGAARLDSTEGHAISIRSTAAPLDCRMISSAGRTTVRWRWLTRPRSRSRSSCVAIVP